MWTKLKKSWMNNPKGTFINLNESTALRLIEYNIAETCDPPESNPKKNVYFPKVNIDPGEVAMVNDINRMHRKELIEFINENNLKVDLKTVMIIPDKKYPNDKTKSKHISTLKLLSNLRTEVAAESCKANLRFEIEEEDGKKDITIPRKPNLGKDKMMKQSPVEK